MSNKKLTRYYVLSQTAYDALKKKISIDENTLNPIDKHIFEILKNKSLSSPEKFLLYSQYLSKQIHKIRERGKKKEEDGKNQVVGEKKATKKNLAEQFTQTEPPPEVIEQMTQGVQTTPKRKGSDYSPRNIFDDTITDTFTDEDEEFESKYLQTKRFTDDKRSNVSLGDELFGRPFDPKMPETLRRSKRIQMRQMPKTFDEETAAAALEYAQEEFQDTKDRNYVQRMSTSPSIKIIEHRPTGGVLTVSLDDIVDVVDDDDELRLPQKRKRKTPISSVIVKKTKKDVQQKGGAQKILWEKF